MSYAATSCQGPPPVYLLQACPLVNQYSLHGLVLPSLQDDDAVLHPHHGRVLHRRLGVLLIGHPVVSDQDMDYLAFVAWLSQVSCGLCRPPQGGRCSEGPLPHKALWCPLVYCRHSGVESSWLQFDCVGRHCYAPEVPLLYGLVRLLEEQNDPAPLAHVTADTWVAHHLAQDVLAFVGELPATGYVHTYVRPQGVEVWALHLADLHNSQVEGLYIVPQSIQGTWGSTKGRLLYGRSTKN